MNFAPRKQEVPYLSWTLISNCERISWVIDIIACSKGFDGDHKFQKLWYGPSMSSCHSRHHHMHDDFLEVQMRAMPVLHVHHPTLSGRHYTSEVCFVIGNRFEAKSRHLQLRFLEKLSNKQCILLLFSCQQVH